MRLRRQRVRNAASSSPRAANALRAASLTPRSTVPLSLRLPSRVGLRLVGLGAGLTGNGGPSPRGPEPALFMVAAIVFGDLLNDSPGGRVVTADPDIKPLAPGNGHRIPDHVAER